MSFSVTQFTTNTHDKHRPILLTNGFFALFRREMGIQLQQFFAVYEVYFGRKEGLEGGIGFASEILGTQYRRVNTAYGLLQKAKRALLGGNNHLPIPLIYVQRMQVIQLFIGTNGVHIGVNAIARLYLIFGQR